jgi:hypothetical protein
VAAKGDHRLQHRAAHAPVGIAQRIEQHRQRVEVLQQLECAARCWRR